MKIKSYIYPAITLTFFIFICLNQSLAEIERFLPRQGGTTEIWRITHNPTMRDWANYHNTDAWSPDGRYICFAHYPQYESSIYSEVHIYDLHKDKDIKIDSGSNPRWANNHNWLFYVRQHPEDGPPEEKGTQVMWLDVDNNKLTRIAYGVPSLGETDYNDQFLFGYKEWGGEKRQGVRIPILPDSQPLILNGLIGIQWIANPKFPVIFYRQDQFDYEGNDIPFAATRFWCDINGNNVTIGSPMLQRCHQSWIGNGTYLLHGGTPMRGRRWDEPFPSNLHILSAIGCGDISPCGKSGRWISGSGNRGSLQVTDIRSGDGWNYLKAALSYIHDSDRFSYCYSSALEDNDAKGSPDGTKIVFVSNYDLKEGPITEITETVSGISGNRIPVISTGGFPEKGRLSVLNEVIGYESRTPTSFEGLTRGLYNTTPVQYESLTPAKRKEYAECPANLQKGQIVTSFDVKYIPEENRKHLSMPSIFAKDSFPDNEDSPLIWQNRTDIFAAVVRLPDQPHLRKVENEVELIPGENHWETFGYHIFKNGAKLTNEPIRPGASFNLPGPGIYTASAVEWSSLKSKQSLPVQVQSAAAMNVLREKPVDFSWTYERWLVNGEEVTKKDAQNAKEAVKEIIHTIDGIVHREWYNLGNITKRHDLNYEGKPIRHLFYQNGKLIKREYRNRNSVLTSFEIFDSDGYITESILYRETGGQSSEKAHWWYEKGMPVKLVGSDGNGSKKGKGTYIKEGDRWIYISSNTNTDYVPSNFQLFQNFPNPFNTETIIRYDITLISKVNIKIYNILGQEIRSLLNEEKNAGTHLITWDGTNNYGVKVSSGIYIYRMKTSKSDMEAKKMIFLK